jgi:hypothetical protein
VLNIFSLVDLIIDGCVVELQYVYMAAELEHPTCHYHEAIEILRKKANTDEENDSISFWNHQ